MPNSGLVFNKGMIQCGKVHWVIDADWTKSGSHDFRVPRIYWWMQICEVLHDFEVVVLGDRSDSRCDLGQKTVSALLRL